MQFLHDVWVNWFEGEENGYNVCPFHEWKKDDFIEIIDQMPVVKIDSKLFDYIENELLDLPEPLLHDVHQKAYIKKRGERVPLEYCFIAADGNRTIAVNTLSYPIPLRKSRLIPKQEELVLEMAQLMKEKHYPIDYDRKKDYHILSPDPKTMLGLTRKERQLKQLLFMAIDHLKTTGNAAEVRYWLTEWKPEEYRKYQLMNFEEAWKQLYREIEIGWSEKHYHLCEKLVKGHVFFQKLWELQIN